MIKNKEFKITSSVIDECLEEALDKVEKSKPIKTSPQEKN
jgi:hypothetical protein